MKKRILIALVLIGFAAALSSCSTVEDCPALSYEDQTATEQAS